MKKILALVCAVMLCACCATMAACTSPSGSAGGSSGTDSEASSSSVDPTEKYQGTWKLAGVEMDGVTVAGEFSGMFGADLDISMAIEQAGEGSITYNGKSVAMSWEAEGDDAIAITLANDRDASGSSASASPESAASQSASSASAESGEASGSAESGEASGSADAEPADESEDAANRDASDQEASDQAAGEQEASDQAAGDQEALDESAADADQAEGEASSAALSAASAEPGDGESEIASAASQPASSEDEGDAANEVLDIMDIVLGSTGASDTKGKTLNAVYGEDILVIQGENEGRVGKMIFSKDGVIPDMPVISAEDGLDIETESELLGDWTLSGMNMLGMTVYGDSAALSKISGTNADMTLTFEVEGKGTMMGQAFEWAVGPNGATITSNGMSLPVKAFESGVIIDMGETYGIDMVMVFSKKQSQRSE